MACQILNCLGVNSGVNQVRNICVAKLVGCYLEVQTVHHISVVGGFFAKGRFHSMLNFLPVDISGVGSLFRGACFNVLPNTLELSIGQGTAFTVGNHILGGGLFLGFPQTLCQLRRQRHIPSGGFGLQLCCDNRSVMFRVPCSLN